MKDELDYSIHRVSNSMKKKKYDEDDGWKKIKKRTLDRPKFRMPRTWINSAACLAVVLGGILFIHEKLKQERTVVLVQNETSRQADTARVELILANGKSVDLRNVNHLHEEELGIDIVRDSTNDQLTFRTREEASDEIRYNRLMVPKGSDFTFRLPDGSLVTINSESVLSFPVQFPTDSRVVYLEGEAYFEVTKNRHKPFIVQSDAMRVRVLGTTFNFKSDKRCRIAEATLIEGEIEVKGNKEEGQIILAPGQRAELNKNNGRLTVKQVDAKLDAVWHDNLIPFQKADIFTITKALERFYDVKIILSPDIQADKTYSGVLKKKSNIESVLKSLQNSIPIDYKIVGNNIFISPK